VLTGITGFARFCWLREISDRRPVPKLEFSEVKGHMRAQGGGIVEGKQRGTAQKKRPPG